MNLSDLYYRILPRARFWIWFEATFGSDRNTLKSDWAYFTPDEKRRITDRMAKRFSLHVVSTRNDSDDQWRASHCVSSSIARFATLGNPFGHGLADAQYKTSYGGIYQHINSPLGLPCFLVNTSIDGNNIDHMVNAMQVESDQSKISAWAFFDNSGLLTPGKSPLMKSAKILPNKPSDVVIHHAKVLPVNQMKSVAEFVL